jgi:hypothetical protein
MVSDDPKDAWIKDPDAAPEGIAWHEGEVLLPDGRIAVVRDPGRRRSLLIENGVAPRSRKALEKSRVRAARALARAVPTCCTVKDPCDKHRALVEP